MMNVRSIGLLARRVPSARSFSTGRISAEKLRIGYIPEHFSTPLHYAQEKLGLAEHATLQSFPAGTGTMIDAFKANEIDVGIGLTEAWITGLSKCEAGEKPYHMVGAYTQSPLMWAISSGAMRNDIQYVEELKGLKAGISRFGSGSHIMASVLAQTHTSLKEAGDAPFEFVECGPFDALREAVNHGTADFFMWEHFTSKRYWDDGTLKRVGEIETPWNAWHIAAVGPKADERITQHLLPALAKGIKRFEDDKKGAVDFISAHMPYSAEDAEAWYETVRFASASQLGQLDPQGIEKAIEILRTAGVLGSNQVSSSKELAASDAEAYTQS